MKRDYTQEDINSEIARTKRYKQDWSTGKEGELKFHPNTLDQISTAFTQHSTYDGKTIPQELAQRAKQEVDNYHSYFVDINYEAALASLGQERIEQLLPLSANPHFNGNTLRLGLTYRKITHAEAEQLDILVEKLTQTTYKKIWEELVSRVIQIQADYLSFLESCLKQNY